MAQDYCLCGRDTSMGRRRGRVGNGRGRRDECGLVRRGGRRDDISNVAVPVNERLIQIRSSSGSGSESAMRVRFVNATGWIFCTYLPSQQRRRTPALPTPAVGTSAYDVHCPVERRRIGWSPLRSARWLTSGRNCGFDEKQMSVMMLIDISSAAALGSSCHAWLQ